MKTKHTFGNAFLQNHADCYKPNIEFGALLRIKGSKFEYKCTDWPKVRVCFEVSSEQYGFID